MINCIKSLLIGLTLLLFSLESEEDIRYFQEATIPIGDSLKVTMVSINDSLAGQDIIQVRSEGGIPAHYFIELQTGVCYENECRPLDMLIYWNITGRYLGFKLVNGEFLSKYDHKPFTRQEYERLHQLLADPFLPLGNYAFEDLVASNDSNNQLTDGVSGATSKDVLEYVVDGAAYTTHKLWNVVYGPIQQQVINLTEKKLGSFLFTKILQSTNQSDRTWALERISLVPELDDSMVDLVIQIILEEEYFQTYLLLRSLSSEQLESKDLQLQLFKLIGKVDFEIENLIFDHLAEVSNLNPAVVDYSNSIISNLSDPQLVKLLALYSHHGVNATGLYKKLQEMTPHKNPFVERKVLQFLEKHGNIPDQ
jgi:hypothetical protein